MPVYVFYLIKREYAAFVTLRHEFLVSKEHSSLAQSRTVLLTGIPKSYQSLKALSKFTSYLGGVQNIWLVRDLGKDLPDLHKRRIKACAKLEGVETKVMKMAVKAKNKDEKLVKKGKPAKLDNVDPESETSLLDQYIPTKKRPTHRVSKLPIGLPFVGKKVDTINWCQEEILETDKKINEIQGKWEDFKPQGAAFIKFNSQIGAHMFQQCVAHDLPLRMGGRYVEVDPGDVIWGNLDINPYQAKVFTFYMV